MRKYTLLLILLSAFTLQLAAERIEPYKGSRIFWDNTTRKTVFVNGWYSRIRQLQDGRLMAVSECSGINYCFSNNGGSSWSDPVKLVSNTNNTPNCVPDLIQLRDGTIIVCYNPRPSEPYTTDRKYGIRCKRSTDLGKTWSNEIWVYDAQHTFNDGCWEPFLMELPSGELQLYFANEGPYTKSNEQEISVCRSFDGGQTWSEKDRVSFRAGYRDGMPSAILIDDDKTIVVAYEDNGWSGISDFLPTTSRCPLETNWHNYWVGANSADRHKMVDYSMEPLAKGGAPYLVKLGSGETAMSFQSATFNNGKLIMYVYMGDERADNFKAWSKPFITSGSDQVMWNSLAVMDDSVLIAVGGVNSNIEMIKGYPTKLLHAPYGHPNIDGKITKGEGYYLSSCNQIKLGGQYGVVSIADLAYDTDSLYFICRVSDRTYNSGSDSGDGVRLLLDVEDVSDRLPQTGCYSFLFRPDGKIRRWFGQNGNWRKENREDIRMVVTKKSTYYIIEAAIPWSAMGRELPPSPDQRMAVNVEVQDLTSSGLLKEGIPDANVNASWTWMELRLGSLPTPVITPSFTKEDEKANAVVRKSYFTLDGMASEGAEGQIVIEQTIHADGHITTQKRLQKR